MTGGAYGGGAGWASPSRAKPVQANANAKAIGDLARPRRSSAGAA